MSLYDSSQIRVTFVWIFSVSFRSLWKMNEHSWQWALRQRMLLPSFSNHPPIPATAPHWKKKERKFKKKKRRRGERASKLSGQPASQSAPCTLALSSGLDIEEGSTALLLMLLLPRLLVMYMYIRVSPLCVCACVWKPDEMKCQDWATSRENLSIL